MNWPTIAKELLARVCDGDHQNRLHPDVRKTVQRIIEDLEAAGSDQEVASLLFQLGRATRDSDLRELAILGNERQKHAAKQRDRALEKSPHIQHIKGLEMHIERQWYHQSQWHPDGRRTAGGTDSSARALVHEYMDHAGLDPVLNDSLERILRKAARDVMQRLRESDISQAYDAEDPPEHPPMPRP